MPRWRRLVRGCLLTVIAMGLLGVLLWVWLTAPVPAPELVRALPAGGRGAVVEIPDGSLEPELNAGLRALLGYLYRPGGMLDGRKDPRSRVRIPFVDFHSLVAGTRPWRLALWEGPGGERLVLFSPTRPGRLLQWFMPDVRARFISVGGKGLTVGVRRGVLFIGSEAAVRHVEKTLPTVSASDVGVHFSIDYFDASGGALGPRPYLPVPVGITRVRGRLSESSGSWILDLTVTPALDGGGSGDLGPVDLGPWGIESWRSFLEREGIVVGLEQASRQEEDGNLASSWKLVGVRRALGEMARQLEFWTSGPRGR